MTGAERNSKGDSYPQAVDSLTRDIYRSNHNTMWEGFSTRRRMTVTVSIY